MTAPLTLRCPRTYRGRSRASCGTSSWPLERSRGRSAHTGGAGRGRPHSPATRDRPDTRPAPIAARPRSSARRRWWRSRARHRDTYGRRRSILPCMGRSAPAAARRTPLEVPPRRPERPRHDGRSHFPTPTPLHRARQLPAWRLPVTFPRSARASSCPPSPRIPLRAPLTPGSSCRGLVGLNGSKSRIRRARVLRQTRQRATVAFSIPVQDSPRGRYRACRRRCDRFRRAITPSRRR
jgi:hypothetical protein